MKKFVSFLCLALFALIGLAPKFKAFPPGPTEVFANIVFLGETNVGKTSIITRFTLGDDVDINNMIPTVGHDNFIKKINHGGTEVTLFIRDTAGQEQYRSLVPFSLRNADIAVVVCSLDKHESADEISYWLTMVKDHAPNSNIVLLVNKVDLDGKTIVSVEAIERELKNKYNAEEYPICHTSALTGAGMSDLSNILCGIAFERARMVQDRLAAGEMPLRLSEEYKPDKKSCCK